MIIGYPKGDRDFEFGSGPGSHSTPLEPQTLKTSKSLGPPQDRETLEGFRVSALPGLAFEGLGVRGFAWGLGRLNLGLRARRTRLSRARHCGKPQAPPPPPP